MCAVGLGTLLSVTGCIAPQDVELYQPPTLARVPPVIDLTHVDPSAPHICVTSQGTPAVTTFRANVLDTSVSLSLEARWFLNYDPNNNPSTLIIAGDAINVTEVEKGAAFTYQPVTLTSDLLGLRSQSAGVYTLEVVISDSFDAAGVTPRNRAVKKGGYSTSYKWIIDYKGDSPCEA